MFRGKMLYTGLGSSYSLESQNPESTSDSSVSTSPLAILIASEVSETLLRYITN